MMFPPLKFRLLKVGHCTHPECVAMRGGRWRGVSFPALCGLIEHPSRGFMLFDTGYSEHFFEATYMLPERLYRWVTPVTLNPEEALLAQLRSLGIAPAEIRYVLISHFHGDHIAGIKDFPSARFIAMRADFDAMRKATRLGNLFHARLPQLMPHDFYSRTSFMENAKPISLPVEFRPFESGFDLFDDGSLIAVPLPGHAKGQMGLAFRQADNRMVLMVADACWSIDALMDDRSVPWIASRLFDNVANYNQTFQKLRNLMLKPGELTLVPSHCERTWKIFCHESN